MKMRTFIRLLCAALLGVGAAVLVSCGSTGTGLIPSANAGPLRSDFEAVASAAASGNGNCTATESALGKTEQDFLALPATVDHGLHARLEQGISNLRKRALAMCIQPAAGATTSTNTETTTTSTTTTPTTTSTETTPTNTTSPTTTTPTNTQTTPTTAPQNPGGGTEAPGEGSGEQGAGRENGAARENGAGAGNGVSGAGGASPGDGQ
jgi:hypothetical protein